MPLVSFYNFCKQSRVCEKVECETEGWNLGRFYIHGFSIKGKVLILFWYHNDMVSTRFLNIILLKENAAISYDKWLRISIPTYDWLKLSSTIPKVSKNENNENSYNELFSQKASSEIFDLWQDSDTPLWVKEKNVL